MIFNIDVPSILVKRSIPICLVATGLGRIDHLLFAVVFRRKGFSFSEIKLRDWSLRGGGGVEVCIFCSYLIIVIMYKK